MVGKVSGLSRCCRRDGDWIDFGRLRAARCRHADANQHLPSLRPHFASLGPRKLGERRPVDGLQQVE